jgi:threonine synthase
MDICVSSNFERYLYALAGNDATKLAAWMKEFEKTKQLTINGDLLAKAQADFLSARADTSMTLSTIQDYYEKYQYLLCPHSAVGVSAIHQLNMVDPSVVCLATAHEAKFPGATKKAVFDLPDPPRELAVLSDLKTRRSELPNDLKAVQDFVEDRVFNKRKSWMSLASTPTCLKVIGVVAIAILVQQVIVRRK